MRMWWLTTIESWHDLFTAQPKNPLDIIANAKIGSVQGAFLNSSTFLPSSSWFPSSLTISGAPTCTALGTDNLQNVADADQWNMSHLTYNGSTSIPPSLQKLLFLRGGIDWQMNIPLNFGGATYIDVQITLRDNAGTRGDYAGQIPVIAFGGTSFSGTMTMQLTLKQYGHIVMGIRTIDNSGKYAMYESEWIIVP